jgi:hypothetical protein
MPHFKCVLTFEKTRISNAWVMWLTKMWIMHTNITELRSSLGSKKVLHVFIKIIDCSNQINSSTLPIWLTENVKFLLRESVVKGHRHRSDSITHILYVRDMTEESQSLDASHRNLNVDFRISLRGYFGLTVCAIYRWRISLQAKARQE